MDTGSLQSDGVLPDQFVIRNKEELSQIPDILSQLVELSCLKKHTQLFHLNIIVDSNRLALNNRNQDELNIKQL